ncbi:MAG: hypothetical protein KBF88_17615, partial [Polyangiaceae bacterium]|nr:hypothetical protein [Polyangiaceae bacterium]
MTSKVPSPSLTLRSLAAYTLALGVAIGCAGERDPVNRVQTNYVSKSIFVRADKDGQYLKDSDKWYFRATITDVPPTQSAAFIGAAGEMYRVRWQVEENFLFAYRDDEEILGTSGNEKDKKVSGPIAAFPIVSHFDIRKQFNAGTGEELNVIEENTVDRVWQKREYMRVDWSTNRVSQSAFTFPAFESVSAATYFEQDPNSYDKPIFSDDYIDVSAHYTVQPDIATCYYTYRDFGCTPGDITARLSFMKVPTRDYVPREYPDRMIVTKPDGNSIRTIGGSEVSLPVMDQFGFFRTERAQYDQRFGTLEKRYVYRANQWNLWDQWFKRDARGNVISDTGGIKQGNEPAALLPYTERKIRPIVYHVNPDFPEALKRVAKETADGWNATFQETVASLRLLETRGKDAAITQTELRAEVEAMKARGENVFVGCLNNPVAVGDPAVCGAPGTAPRVGDLRYSFMHWVPKPQPSGPLGFGPSYGDPETGELFSASAFIYGASLDTYAQQAVDIVNLLNGKFADFDYLNGISTEDYVKNLNNGEVPGPNASAADVPAPPGSQAFSLEKTKAMIDRVVDKSLLAAIGQQGVPQGTGGGAKEKLETLLQTPIGRKLLDSPETRLLVNKGPKDDLSDADLKSIGNIMVGKESIARERERMNFLGTHGCYYAKEFADESIVGLARAMAAKYPFKATDSAKIREEQQLSIWKE